jgi:hypothetical protein
VADGRTVATLQHRLAELDPLAAGAAAFNDREGLLLEDMLPENKKKTQ